MWHCLCGAEGQRCQAAAGCDLEWRSDAGHQQGAVHNEGSDETLRVCRSAGPVEWGLQSWWNVMECQEPQTFRCSAANDSSPASRFSTQLATTKRRECFVRARIVALIGSPVTLTPLHAKQFAIRACGHSVVQAAAAWPALADTAGCPHNTLNCGHAGHERNRRQSVRNDLQRLSQPLSSSRACRPAALLRVQLASGRVDSGSHA